VPADVQRAARAEQQQPRGKQAGRDRKGDDFSSILRSVDKMRKNKREASVERTRRPTPVGTRRGVVGQRLTISELDAIRDQIKPCWVFPVGAKNAGSLRVEVQVWMNRDGTVREARVLDRARMNSDRYYRAAAEAGLRAVLNPRCGPLKLPASKYDRWKVMIVDFDPSKLGD